MRRTISTLSLFAVLAAAMLQTADLRADEPAILADTTVDGEVVVDGGMAHLDDDYVGYGIDDFGAYAYDAYGGVCFPRPGRTPDLFYNYWLPAGCGSIGAQLYLSPHPVPPLVGHTAITYQPLMPHEFLYPHHRTYYQYYAGGRGLTRTHVKYKVAPFHRAGLMLHTFKLAR